VSQKVAHRLDTKFPGVAFIVSRAAVEAARQTGKPPS
jgi:hypothetical protein